MYENLTSLQLIDIDKEDKLRREYKNKLIEINQELEELEEGHKLIEFIGDYIDLTGKFSIDELERIIELKKEKNKLE